MSIKRNFCVLGMAMNAKNMKLGEDISGGHLATALLSFAFFVIFVAI